VELAQRGEEPSAKLLRSVDALNESLALSKVDCKKVESSSIPSAKTAREGRVSQTRRDRSTESSAPVAGSNASPAAHLVGIEQIGLCLLPVGESDSTSLEERRDLLVNIDGRQNRRRHLVERAHDGGASPRDERGIGPKVNQ
jgi:hypothetical protein